MRLAAPWAWTTVSRAGLVNRSNTGSPFVSAATHAARVLLVDGLPGNTERRRDLLPRPVVHPGLLDLERLELLEELAQRGHRPQPDARVGAVHCLGEFGCFSHGVILG